MKYFFTYILLFILTHISAQSPYTQFRMVGNAIRTSGNTTAWEVINDSTYLAEMVVFFGDQTGGSYYPTQITDSFRVFTGNEQIYRIDSVDNKTLGTVRMWIVEYEGNHGLPRGQLMVYDPDGRDKLPSVPFGINGVNAQMQAAINAYNARIEYYQILDLFDITNDTLYASLSGDNMDPLGVDLSPYLDNTDAQTLSWLQSTGSLSISGGNSITINPMTGATGAVAGEQGLVPKPLAGEQILFLRGDGSWANPTVGGDNWGSQVVISDVTLTGDGTAGSPLSVSGSYFDNQTIDTFLISNDTLIITLEDDNEAPYFVNLSPYLDNTDTQDLSLSNDTLYLVDGGSVYLGGYLDNTIDSTVLVQDSILVSYYNGVENRRDTIRFTTLNTDEQTLTYNGLGDLSISNGNSVDLSDLLDNTDNQTIDSLLLSGSTLIITLEDDNEAPYTLDLSTFLDNTDDQQVTNFSISSDILTLEIESDGQPPHTIDLSPYLDNTDSQVLSYNTITNRISISNGNDIDISEIDTDKQTVDSFLLSGNNLLLALERDGEAPYLVDLSQFLDNTRDSTILSQDSILVSFYNGVEDRRDTIRLSISNVTELQYTIDSIYTVIGNLTGDSIFVTNNYGGNDDIQSYLDSLFQNIENITGYEIIVNNNYGGSDSLQAALDSIFYHIENLTISGDSITNGDNIYIINQYGGVDDLGSFLDSLFQNIENITGEEITNINQSTIINNYGGIDDLGSYLDSLYTNIENITATEVNVTNNYGGVNNVNAYLDSLYQDLLTVDNVDSTTLSQDSILISYYNGTEVRRDTVRVTSVSEVQGEVINNAEYITINNVYGGPDSLGALLDSLYQNITNISVDSIVINNNYGGVNNLQTYLDSIYYNIENLVANEINITNNYGGPNNLQVYLDSIYNDIQNIEVQGDNIINLGDSYYTNFYGGDSTLQSTLDSIIYNIENITGTEVTVTNNYGGDDDVQSALDSLYQNLLTVDNVDSTILVQDSILISYYNGVESRRDTIRVAGIDGVDVTNAEYITITNNYGGTDSLGAVIDSLFQNIENITGDEITNIDQSVIINQYGGTDDLGSFLDSIYQNIENLIAQEISITNNYGGVNNLQIYLDSIYQNIENITGDEVTVVNNYGGGPDVQSALDSLYQNLLTVDNVDSTILTQDSILISYYNGIESRRDTIRVDNINGASISNAEYITITNNYGGVDSLGAVLDSLFQNIENITGDEITIVNNYGGDTTLQSYLDSLYQNILTVDNVDSTVLVQDSILISYYNGIENRRDTIRVAGIDGIDITNAEYITITNNYGGVDSLGAVLDSLFQNIENITITNEQVTNAEYITINNFYGGPDSLGALLDSLYQNITNISVDSISIVNNYGGPNTLQVYLDSIYNDIQNITVEGDNITNLGDAYVTNVYGGDSTLQSYLDSLYQNILTVDNVDSTVVIQDSIIVSYYNGVEERRDTIRVSPGEASSISGDNITNTENIFITNNYGGVDSLGPALDSLYQNILTADNVDSTILVQDSILVSYYNQIEVRRDTIRIASIAGQNISFAEYISITNNYGGTDSLGAVLDSLYQNIINITTSSSDDQILTYNGLGDLSIEDGNTVDLSDLLDNTDNQTIDSLLLNGTILIITLEGDNELPYTVDLSSLQDGIGTDDQQVTNFSINANILTLEVEDDGQAPHTVDLSTYLDNTDTQDLSLSNDTLYLTDGGFVLLTSYLDNTDDQTIDSLLLDGNTLVITLEDDNESPYTLDLSQFLDNTDTQDLSFNNDTLYLVDGGSVYLGDYLDDTDTNDVDSTRLTQDSVLVYYFNGTEVRRDTVITPDDQTLSYNPATDEITIIDGNTIDITEVDTDDQTLSYAGLGDLSISEGNSVDISDLLDNTDDQQVTNFSVSDYTLTLEIEDDGQAPHQVILPSEMWYDSAAYYQLYVDTSNVDYRFGFGLDFNTLGNYGATLVTGSNSLDIVGNLITPISTNFETAIESYGVNVYTEDHVGRIGGRNLFGGLYFQGNNTAASTDAHAFHFRGFLENEPTAEGGTWMEFWKHDGAGGLTAFTDPNSKLFRIYNANTPVFTSLANGDVSITGDYLGGGYDLSVTNPYGGGNFLQQTIDSIYANMGDPADGNGLISALPLGDVTINALNNVLEINSLGTGNNRITFTDTYGEIATGSVGTITHVRTNVGGFELQYDDGANTNDLNGNTDSLWVSLVQSTDSWGYGFTRSGLTVHSAPGLGTATSYTLPFANPSANTFLGDSDGNGVLEFIDYSGFLTSEVNDLSSVVTWATVPDAYISESSVTQHQVALSITESQISDLSHTTDFNIGDDNLTLTGDRTLNSSSNTFQITNGGSSNGSSLQLNDTESRLVHAVGLDFATFQASTMGIGMVYISGFNDGGTVEISIDSTVMTHQISSTIRSAVGLSDFGFLVAIDTSASGDAWYRFPYINPPVNTVLGNLSGDNNLEFSSIGEYSVTNPLGGDNKLQSVIDSLNANLGAGGASTLSGLTDTDLTGLADNNLLQYNSGTGNWEPTEFSTGTSSAPILAVQKTSNQTLTGTPTVIAAYDTPIKTTTMITFDNTNGFAIINSAGLYEIVFQAVTEMTSGSIRRTSFLELQVSTGSGWVNVTELNSSVYNRTAGDGEGTGVIVYTNDFAAGDSIRIVGSDNSVSETIQLTRAYLQIKPLEIPYALIGGGGSEINDLTASVTWANVPDANITESSVTQHEAALATAMNLDDLITLTGVAEGAVNLGTFTGSTITDNQTIKAAMQELETAVESAGGSPAITDREVAIGNGTGITSEAGFVFNAGGVLELLADSGTNNLMIGSSTTFDAPDGTSDNNTFIGIGAFSGTLSAADDNTGVGLNVLAALTSGDQNTVIGSQAGASVSNSNRNTIVGYDAADDLNGSNNVVMGASAANNQSTTTSSVYLGHFTANLNTTAGLSDNVAIGAQTGEDLSSIGYTAIGYRAAMAAGGVNADYFDYGVALGNLAGYALGTANHRSIFIGYSAGNGETTYNDLILIGSEASATQSNQIVIGHESAGYESTQLKVRNYKWNIDQTLGAGQDGYVMTYNNTSGELELQAAAGGGGGTTYFVDEQFGGGTVIGPDTLQIITGQSIGSDYAISAETTNDSLVLKFFPAGLLALPGATLDPPNDELIIIDVSESPDKAKRIDVDDFLGGAVNSTTPSEASTTDISFTGQKVGFIHQVIMSSITSGFTLTFSGAVDGGVYTLHFRTVTGTDAVTFPSNVYWMDETAVGTINITQSTKYTMYYDGTNYYME